MEDTMLITIKPKPKTAKASDNSERESAESNKNRTELDARLDRLSVSRVNLSNAVAKVAQGTRRP